MDETYLVLAKNKIILDWAIHITLVFLRESSSILFSMYYKIVIF